MTSQNTYADIVVVAAGMAGLYFSWRMLGFGGQTVINLEKLNRTGGRLDTDIVRINGEPVKNEEGGMRFDAGMKNLMWLLQTLGRSAEIMLFKMGDACAAINSPSARRRIPRCGARSTSSPRMRKTNSRT